MNSHITEDGLGQSFETAYETLRRRFEYRGMKAPEVKGRSAGSSDKYCSEYRDGVAYMTVDDAKAYIGDKYGVLPSERIRSVAAAASARENAPVPTKRELRIAKRRENHEKQVTGLVAIIGRWLPDTTTYSAHGRRFRSSSAAAVILVLVFAMIFALPIGINVLIAEENAELHRAEDRLHAQEEEIRRLEAELDSKNNSGELLELARDEYGMIPIGDATTHYLKLDPKDAIETFEVEKDELPGFLALLSALGINIGN